MITVIGLSEVQFGLLKWIRTSAQRKLDLESHVDHN